jgi:FixJ family two-component response regulator
MPGLDGLEFQRRLNENTHRIPLIVIIAHDEKVRKTALREGAIAVFGKPFRSAELLTAIESALNLLH